MKTKRIISIVVSSIVLLFAIFVLVSAFIPKNYNFNLAQPDRITIYNSNGDQVTNYYKDSDDDYNKIMELYNKGFKTSFMQSFFQGKGFKKVQTVDSTNSFKSDSIKNVENTIFIEFCYTDEQQTSTHGCDVKLTTDESVYRHVFIEIKNSQVLSAVNAYIIKGGEDFTSTSKNNIRYTSYASHHALYDYLNDGILA